MPIDPSHSPRPQSKASAELAARAARFGVGPGHGDAGLEELRARIAEHLARPRAAGRGELVPAETSAMGVPLLRLRGAPRERARQAGELVRGIAGEAIASMLRQMTPARATRWAIDTAMAGMALRAPRALRRELRAFAAGAGMPLRRVFGLTVAGDLHAAGCSTIVARPPITGDVPVLFGRNLDFLSFGLSDACACVTVHHPEPGSGEIPYAQVGWTGLWGTYTGWNQRGLCLGNMQAYNPRADVPRGVRALFGGGTPTAWIYTRLLRECASVEQALARLEAMRDARERPLAATNLMLADATGDSALVESDARRLRVRRAERSLLYATNHFNHPEMTEAPPACWRYDALNAWRDGWWSGDEGARPCLTATGLRFLLDQVNQGEFTVHSVVFSPVEGVVHLAAGAPPSSGGKWCAFGMDVWR